MYIIGYIDDESDVLNDYIKRLSRRDIKMKVAPVGALQQIKQWLHLEPCRIYCLKTKSRRSGKEEQVCE